MVLSVLDIPTVCIIRRKGGFVGTLALLPCWITMLLKDMKLTHEVPSPKDKP